MPRVLIFPQYIPEVQFNIQQLTPAEALFRLLQCLVNARNFPDGGMAATAHLARQVIAYNMTYPDIESASEWIKKIIIAG
jgi:predicted fused transcriptional regulator/phosphomethylpyrimidine kinase